MSKVGFVLLVGVLCVNVLPSSAQREARFGGGRSFVGERLDSVRVYDLWLLSAGHSWPLTKTQSTLTLNAVIDVQFGYATTFSNSKRDFDLAFNLSTELIWRIHQNVGLQFSIGSGPAYLSSVSDVQVRGFVFSNNFIFGLRFSPFNTPIVIAPQVRFRHLSNASTRQPNLGIDNFLAALQVGLHL